MVGKKGIRARDMVGEECCCYCSVLEVVGDKVVGMVLCIVDIVWSVDMADLGNLEY